MKFTHEVTSLSQAFTKDILKDEAKKGLIVPQILTRMIFFWPDSNRPVILFATWLMLINFIIIEILHTSFIFFNLNADVRTLIVTFTTVTTALETLVRIHSLIFKKHIINDVLVKIWKVFWPFDLSTAKEQKELKLKLSISLGLLTTFLCFAVFCNSFISGMPFISYHGIVLNSVFPFNWDQPFVYEIIYVWQYFSNWLVVLIIAAFDFLFVQLVMICGSQFTIIQAVIKHIFMEESKRHRKFIFGDAWEQATDRDLMDKCLQQHKMLLEICSQLESSFNIVILMQYTTSVMCLCSGVLTLKLDPSQFYKMLSFSLGHMVQLFEYCYVGEELTYQSEQLSDAIYECNWHLTYDREFRKTMVMMIQRSQRAQCLTAAGVLNLDLSGYLKVVRLSFSFYTVFDNVMKRRGY